MAITFPDASIFNFTWVKAKGEEFFTLGRDSNFECFFGGGHPYPITCHVTNLIKFFSRVLGFNVKRINYKKILVTIKLDEIWKTICW